MPFKEPSVRSITGSLKLLPRFNSFKLANFDYKTVDDRFECIYVFEYFDMTFMDYRNITTVIDMNDRKGKFLEYEVRDIIKRNKVQYLL